MASIIKVLGCHCFLRSIKNSLQGYAAARTQLIHNVAATLQAADPRCGKCISRFKDFMDINGNGWGKNTDASVGHNGQRLYYVTAAMHDIDTLSTYLVKLNPVCLDIDILSSCIFK